GGNRFRESTKPGANALDGLVDSRNQHRAPNSDYTLLSQEPTLFYSPRLLCYNLSRNLSRL
ncbi:MAG: hypothetical protein WAU10_24425, partial [Caldilineaceae bacterium]